MEILVFISKVIASIAFSYVFISFFEYQIHRHLMHRKRLPAWVYEKSAYFLDTFEAHAVRHHRTWYKEFDFEPNPEGREDNLDIKIGETAVVLLAFTPFYILITWLSPVTGIILIATSFFHNRLWNVLHREMHIPQGAFFHKWPAFQYLARHHFLHHNHVGKNYNVAFPLWDYLLSSIAKPRLADVRELLRLGYITPRQKGTQALVSRWVNDVSLQRAA